MEPPPPAIPATTAAATPPPHQSNHYPDSIDSSPRSRAADAWDDPQPPPRLRLMCSYGGHIVPRPHDKSLCYVGGETRIVVADRNSSLSDLSAKLSKTLLAGKSFALKYQLPSEDLDSLISVTTDEDLDNMIDEYDRTRPNRLRLFLFSAAAVKPNESASSKSNDESDDWFVAALNGGGGGGSGSGGGANNTVNNNNNKGSSASVNCLLGLDDDGFIGDGSNHSAVAAVDTTAAIQQQKKAQDAQSVSVPDSPMLDTTSSFGSTSSSPSLANLPPIRVHLADGGFQDQKTVPIEDHFSQMNIAAVAVRQDESSAASGFLALSSPPSTGLNPIAVSSSPSAPGIGIEYAAANRDLISDDERSDHGGGIPIGYWKQQSSLSHKQTIATGAVMDLPSPDSVSSDSSFGNPSTIQHRSKGLGYEQQNPIFQIPAKLHSDNNMISDYVFQQQQFELSQPQQFVRHLHPGGGSGGAQYIHHHNPAAYYHPVYASQPPPHQYPVYYLPARQPYNNMSVQSATTAGAPPSLLHVAPSGQHYNMHPSSAQYEYGGGDQGRAQIYYTQPLGPPTMTADGINQQQQQQQMRTSQPL